MNSHDFKGPEPTELHHETIDNDLYVDRYLMDQLSPEEKAGFENHFLSCAHCLEQLQLTESLRKGLRDYVGEEIQTAKNRWLWGLFLKWMAHRTAMIASAVVVLGLLGLFFAGGRFESGPVPELFSQPFAQAQTHVLDLNTMRGPAMHGDERDRPELTFQPETSFWVLRGSLSKQIEKVRLQLLDSNGNTLWEGTSPNSHQFFAVKLPAGFLKQGRHQLIVHQVAADGETYPLAYEFEVIQSP